MAETERRFVDWVGKIKFGIPFIDKQHLELCDLCEELYQGIAQQRSYASSQGWQSSLSDEMRKLFESLRNHFATEEKLLATVGYEHLTEHKQSHRHCLTQIADLLKDFDKSGMQTVLDFVKFFNNWLYQHITFEDRMYVKTVLEYMHRQTQGE